MSTLALPGFSATDPAHRWRDREIIRTRSQGIVTLDNVLVTTREALAQAEHELVGASRIAADTETSGLVPALGARPVGYAFAYRAAPQHVRAFYIPVGHVFDQTVPQLGIEFVVPFATRVMSAPGIADFHHAKFDLGMFRAHGVRWKRTIRDVSIESVIHNENEQSFGLKQLADKYIVDGARTEEKALDEWMKRDARQLGLPFKKRRKGEDQIIGPVTYLEKYGYSRAPIALAGVYGCHDVFYTLFLPDIFDGEVKRYAPLYTRELAVSEALLDMEYTGLNANPQEMRLAQERANREAEYWLREMRRMIGSPTFEPTDDALRDLFYKHLKMTVPKQTKGEKDSVDKEARDILAEQHPEHSMLVKTISEHSKIEKIATTYGSAFLRWWSPTTQSIHPSYNQLEDRDEGGVPVTGRLSSQNPNIQNVAKKPIHLSDCGCDDCCKAWAKGKLIGPERKPGAKSTLSIRRYFVVPAGMVRVYIDFSQIELRVLAWYSRDPTLLHAYANDLDIHAITSEEVTGGDRDIAKQVNFGNSYGMTEIGLAKRMVGYAKDPEGTREKAKKVLARFFQKYHGIPTFRDNLSLYMRRNGGMFVSAMGRPRRIEEIRSDKRWERERGERMMMSSAISGTAADMMKEVLIRNRRFLASQYGPMESTGVGAKQSIHDEIVYDIPIVGCDRTIVALAHYTNWWPMFADNGVPIRSGIKVTTTTWEDAKEVVINPDGTVAYVVKK